MRTGRCVLVPRFRKLPLRKSRPQPYERGPQAAMHERSLAVDQLAHQNVSALTRDLRSMKDRAPLRMPPPTAADPFPGDRFSQRRDRTVRRLQDDPMLTNEVDSLMRTQRGLPPRAPALSQETRPRDAKRLGHIPLNAADVFYLPGTMMWAFMVPAFMIHAPPCERLSGSPVDCVVAPGTAMVM